MKFLARWKIYGGILLTCLFVPFCAYLNQETAYLDRAENQYKRQQYEKAKRSYREHLRRFPQSSYNDMVYERLGEVNYQLNDKSAARKHFEDVVKRFPRSIYSLPSRYYLGVMLLEENKFSEALRIFYSLSYYLPSKPAITDPGLESYDVTDINVRMLYSTRRDKAVEWGYRGLFQMGECYIGLLSYGNAQLIFEFLQNQRTPWVTIQDIQSKLGICYFYQKRLGDAHKLLQQSLQGSQTDPRKKEAYRFLGATEYAMGNRVRGIAHMLHYMELEDNPDKKQQAHEEIVHFIEHQLVRDELLQISTSYAHRFPGDYAHLRLIELDIQEGDISKALKDLNMFLSGLGTGKLRSRALQLKESVSSVTESTSRKIACIGPFTGSLSSFGEKVFQGVQLSVQLHNQNHPKDSITLIRVDSRGDPSTIAGIYHDLVTREKVVAVVGPVLSKVVIEAASYAQRYHLPTITPTATRAGLPDLSDYLFRNCLTYEAQVGILLDYACNTLNVKNFCVLHPDNNYGKTLAQAFTAAAPSYGARISQQLTYEEYQTDFQALLSVLETVSVEGIFIPDFAERIAVIAPQIPFLGIQQFRLFGSDSWNSDSLITLGGIYVDGSFFVDDFFINSLEQPVKEFVTAFNAYYNDVPDRLAAQAYDAAGALLNVIGSHGISREKVRTGLLQLKNYRGVTGTFDFLPNGDTRKSGIVLSVSEGTIIQVR